MVKLPAAVKFSSKVKLPAAVKFSLKVKLPDGSEVLLSQSEKRT